MRDTTFARFLFRGYQGGERGKRNGIYHPCNGGERAASVAGNFIFILLLSLLMDATPLSLSLVLLSSAFPSRPIRFVAQTPIRFGTATDCNTESVSATLLQAICPHDVMFRYPPPFYSLFSYVSPSFHVLFFFRAADGTEADTSSVPLFHDRCF